MKNLFRAAVTALVTALLYTLGATGAFAAPGADGSNPPSPGPSGPVDPALQQVVRDSEPIDLNTQVVLDHGHIDIGPRLLDGKWRLMARDDTSIPSVWRPLDKIVFKVGNASIMKLPKDNVYAFTGAKPGQSVYVVPQSEIDHVPWLGWSTQSPLVVHSVDGQMQLVFEGHQGEGRFTNFYQAGNFGGPQQNFTSATPTAQVLNVDINTHVHTNWVFTRPGVHLVRLTAKATLKNGAQVQDSQVLRFAVGDQTSPQQARAQQWKAQAHPQAHPRDDAKLAGDSPASSRSTLIWVGSGLLVCGVIALVAAILVLRSSKRRKQSALEATGEPEADDRAEPQE